jgi:transposase-like protein
MRIVRQYSDVFRSRMVERLVGPEAVSANALALEVGVSQNSLSRWLREARSLQGMSETSKGSKRGRERSKKKWSGAEKLRIVMEASALTGSELGALLRREGVHEAELQEWRAAAEAALGEPLRNRTKSAGKPSLEAKRIRELERELDRKEKALAETAALLVLKKKVQEIWGDEDDTTHGRSGR